MTPTRQHLYHPARGVRELERAREELKTVIGGLSQSLVEEISGDKA